MTFHVDGGSMDAVLTRIATVAGRRIIFDPALVRGLSAPGVNGVMSVEAAIQRALEGTRLTLRLNGQGDLLVVRQVGEASAPSGGKMLPTVQVAAAVAGSGDGGTPLGANGSSDPIATEGTKSYTTSATTIATKTPLALKDTPETISVITRQQLDDRSLNNFSEGLAALPGVTVTQSGADMTFSSRGFEITNIQIDGGSPVFIGSNNNYNSQYRVLDDLSIYDSVTLERGAAGTFTGVGSPGGAISLERKRPLDHPMLEMTGEAGSWDRFRGVVDTSSPSLFNGLVRARVVVTGERNDFFYEDANRQYGQAYANIEIAPVHGTTINIGGQISRDRSTPFLGLPTDAAGQLINLPVDTCLCTTWSHQITDTKGGFLEIRQALGPNWTLHLNTDATLQSGKDDDFSFTTLYGQVGVTPGALDQGYASEYRSTRHSDQYVVDLFTDGKFNLLSMPVQLTFGANYQKLDQNLPLLDGYAPYSNYVILPFNAASFQQQPDSAFSSSGAYTTPRSTQEQYGIYGSVRFSPLPWAHFTIAERYTSYGTVDLIASDGAIVQRTSDHYVNLSPPNGGVVFDLTKQVTLFGNYTSIFDKSNEYTVAGKLVPPQTGFNIEGGSKAAFYKGKLNLSGSIFDIEDKNVPVSDPSGVFYVNSNTSYCCYITDGTQYTSRGVEFQAQGALTPRLQIDASYTYTDFKLKFGSAADVSNFTPVGLAQSKNLAKLWGVWRSPFFEGRLSLGLGAHIESGIKIENNVYEFTGGRFQETTVNTPRAGYATADALIKYSINPNLYLQANLTNMFDEKYYTTVVQGTGSFYGQPRAFLITLEGSL